MGNRGKSPLFIIFTTIFVDLIGFGIVLPLLPFYAEHFGAPPYQIGLLVASFSLMQFLFAPLWGRLSDRYGRRPIILMSLVASSVSYLAFGFATSLFVLFLSRIFAGIASASISAAQAYISDVTTTETRAKGMGIVGAAFGLGFIFGPILGGLLSEPGAIFHFVSIAYSSIGSLLGHPKLLGSHWLEVTGKSFGALPRYDVPAYFASLLCLANAGLAYFRLPESLHRAERNEVARQRAFSIRSFINALSHPYVGVLILLYFLITFATAITYTTFPLFFKETLKVGTVENGYLFTYLGFIGVIVQGALIGYVVQLLGERIPVVIGIAITTGGFILLTLFTGWTSVLLSLALMGVGQGIAAPNILSLVTKFTTATEHGGILGVNASLSSLARVLGPVWGGAAYSYWGMHSPFFTGAVALGLTFLLSFRVLHERYDTVPGEASIGEEAGE